MENYNCNLYVSRPVRAMDSNAALQILSALVESYVAMLAIIVGFYTLMVRRSTETPKSEKEFWRRLKTHLIASRSFKLFFVLCSFLIGWSLTTMYLIGMSFLTSDLLNWGIGLTIAYAVFVLFALYLTVQDIRKSVVA